MNKFEYAFEKIAAGSMPQPSAVDPSNPDTYDRNKIAVPPPIKNSSIKQQEIDEAKQSVQGDAGPTAYAHAEMAEKKGVATVNARKSTVA